MPFLAGTYDERMFEALCLRSQVFELLPGGAVSGRPSGGRARTTWTTSEGREDGMCLLIHATERALALLPGRWLRELNARLPRQERSGRAGGKSESAKVVDSQRGGGRSRLPRNGGVVQATRRFQREERVDEGG